MRVARAVCCGLVEKDGLVLLYDARGASALPWHWSGVGVIPPQAARENKQMSRGVGAVPPQQAVPDGKGHGAGVVPPPQQISAVAVGLSSFRPKQREKTNRLLLGLA